MMTLKAEKQSHLDSFKEDMFVLSPVTLMSIKDFVMWKASLYTWPLALINHLSLQKKKKIASNQM